MPDKCLIGQDEFTVTVFDPRQIGHTIEEGSGEHSGLLEQPQCLSEFCLGFCQLFHSDTQLTQFFCRVIPCLVLIYHITLHVPQARQWSVLEKTGTTRNP